MVVTAVQLCVLHGLQSGCHLLDISDMEIKHYQFSRFKRVSSGVSMLLLLLLLDADITVSAATD